MLLDYLSTQKLLKKYSLPSAPGFLATDLAQAREIAEREGYPLYFKVVTLAHKTEKGGVARVESAAELEKVWVKLKSLGQGQEEILIQPALKGEEVLAGLKRDPQFGPVILFGAGGIFVELLKDVSFRLAPFGKREARQMIQEIKLFPLLNGYRGREKVALEKLVSLLVNFSRLAEKEKDISQIDFNPIIANKNGVWIVDAKIFLS